MARIRIEKHDFQRCERILHNPSNARDTMLFASLVLLMNTDVGQLVLSSWGARSLKMFREECLAQLEARY